MLFVTYWKLNEEMSVKERQEVASMLVESGTFPPEDVEVIRWDATPDGWGILVSEAASAEDVIQAIEMWRAPAPGFFEKTVTAPAQPVHEAIERTGELLANLRSED